MVSQLENLNKKYLWGRHDKLIVNTLVKNARWRASLRRSAKQHPLHPIFTILHEGWQHTCSSARFIVEHPPPHRQHCSVLPTRIALPGTDAWLLHMLT